MYGTGTEYTHARLDELFFAIFEFTWVRPHVSVCKSSANYFFVQSAFFFNKTPMSYLADFDKLHIMTRIIPIWRPGHPISSKTHDDNGSCQINELAFLVPYYAYFPQATPIADF